MNLSDIPPFERRQLIYDLVDYVRDTMEEQFLSLAETARKTRIPEYSIKQAIDAGELPAMKSGNSQNCKLLISTAKLKAWIKTREA